MKRAAPQVTSRTVQPITVGRLRLLRVNGVELLLDAYQARVNDQPICLALKEFEALRALMEQAGQVQSHRQLLDTAAHRWPVTAVPLPVPSPNWLYQSRLMLASNCSPIDSRAVTTR